MYRLKLLAVLLVLAVFWCSGPVFAQLQTTGASDFKDGATSNPADSTIPNTAMEVGYDESGNPVYQECASCPPQYKPVFEDLQLKDSVFVCYGTTIYDTLIVTDQNTDQIVTVTLEDGPGVFTSTPSVSPVTSYYEFTPDTSGVYEATFKALDDMGYSTYVTKTYYVFLNNPPEITNGGAVISSDQVNIELTYDVDAVDNEGDPITYEISSGPGSIDPATGLISFTPAAAGTYQLTVEAGDSCGTDMTIITFEVSETPVDLVCPDSYIEEFICEPTTLCYPIEGVPAGAVVTVEPPSAWWDAEQGTVCFYTNCSVEKNLTVAVSSGDKATPPIGTDTCQFTVNVTLNSPPTVILPGDTTVSSCEPQEICVPVGIADINDNIANIDVYPSYAVYNEISGMICMTPETAGPVNLIVTVTDECQVSRADTMVINVDLDSPPEVNAGEDFTANLCSLSEICFPVSVIGDDIVETSVSPVGAYDDQNKEICFTPESEGTTQLILSAVDNCGNSSSDTVNVTVVLDPTVSIACPEPGYQLICEPTEICVDLAVVPSDAVVESSYGTYSNGQLCFYADTAGTYTIDVTATSDCGTDQCTVEYVVELGEQPEITCPIDPLDYEICAGDQICFSLPIYPADASIQVEGAEYVDGQFCFTPPNPGTYEINVAASTDCGTDNCTITVNVGFGDIPQIACPAEPVSQFLCEPGEICYPLEISPLDATVSSSFGTITVDQLCFMADTAGTYNVDVTAETGCGTETCTISFVVEFGEAPVISCPIDPIPYDLCAPGEICVDLPITPVNAVVTTSFGTYANGQLCFNADTSGTYEIKVDASTDCGTQSCNIIVEVNIEEAPSITCPAEPVSQFLCEPGEICYPLEISPLDATVSSSFGTVTVDQLCFMADTAGTYNIDVTAETGCGTETCTISFVVVFGEAPVISCPIDPIPYDLCAPGEICIDLPITPANAVVTASYGTYADGQLCFNADTSGTYEIKVDASTDCGTESCTIFVEVNIEEEPSIICPTEPVSQFLCEPGEICYPLEISPLDATVSSSFGTITVDQLCFMADTAGTYNIEITAGTGCGTDNCTISFVVVFGEAPVISCPIDPIPYDLCAPGEICIDLPITPANAVVTASYGTYADGQLCFNADTSGTYEIKVDASTDCGTESCTIFVEVNIEEAPSITCPAEPISEFLCEPGEICYQLEILPDYANVTTSFGTYSDGQLCFMADTAGTYNIEVTAGTGCGTDNCTISFVVDFGETPVIDCPSEPYTYQICEPTEFCIDLPVTPDNAVLTPSYGTIENGQLCFTADTAGTYEISVSAETDCGSDECVITAIVTQGDFPEITCPAEPINKFLCEPSEICYPLEIMPINATVSASFGTVADGQLCFDADTAGIYNIEVTAETDCGTDNCTIQFVVEMGEAPVIECPLEPITETICQPGPICIDLPISAGATVESSFGDYAEGQLCFNADTSGTYQISVTATNECGQDECVITAVINIEEPAAIECPAEPVAVELCEPSEYCYPLAVSPEYAQVNASYGTFANGELCFNADTSGTYAIEVTATTDCGTDVCTITFNVNIGEAPEISCPIDPVNVELCDPQEFCFDLPITPADAEITIDGGTYNNGQVCIDATESGQYNVTVTASTSCGTDQCTITFDVNIGETPVIACPVEPFEYTMCEPTEYCIDLPISPVNAEISTSFGYYANGQLCFTADTAGSYLIDVNASTSCGEDQCRIAINITQGSTPELVCPGDTSIFICSPDTICIPIEGIHPGDQVTVSPVSAWYDSEKEALCFYTNCTVQKYLEIEVATDCGVKTCSFTADVTMNRNPLVILGPDMTINMCGPDEICIPAGVDDPDGNLYLTEVTPIGTYDEISGNICFTPDTAGLYTIVLKATDECAAFGSDTVQVRVNYNDAPTVTSADNFDRLLCDVSEVCFPVTIQDGQNNIETIDVNFGQYNDITGEVCFTADTAGVYGIITTVVDSCGLSDADTTTVMVTFGEGAAITCPTGPIDYFICEPTTLCHDLPITPFDAAVEVSYGTYVDGQLCFDADTSGSYVIEVSASSDCGDDQCTVVFNVVRGELPAIDCPSEPISKLICEPQEICRELTITPETAVVTPSFGSYTDGQLCFMADTSGHYEIEVTAETDCGTTNCTVSFDVEIGVAPEITCPQNETVFLCEAEEICRDLTVSPLDAEVTVSPVGLYQNGQVCFIPDTAGSYDITVTAATDCGQTECSFTIDVVLNSAPSVNAGDDAEFFQCEFSEICLPITSNDPDENITSTTVSHGIYNDNTHELCFTPDTAGVYCIEVIVTDECGLEDKDTVCVTVTTGDSAVIECPAEPIDKMLCDAGEICIPVGITPGTAEVTVSYGIYADGEVCFNADTAGTYTIDVTASEACGDDECQLTVNVSFGAVAEITCPDLPIAVSLCDPGEIKVTLPITPSNAGVTVQPIGSYNTSTGQLVFMADTAGTYVITVDAEAPCGTAQCQVTVNVSLEDSPAIVCPEPIDEMLCVATTDELCFDVDITGSSPEVTVLPEGSYSGGEVCIPVTEAGEFTYKIIAENICGADTCEVPVTITENQPPVLTVPNDILIPSCTDDLSEVCIDGIYARDPEGDEITITQTCGPGTYTAVEADSGKVCFTPESNDITYQFCIEASDGCQTVSQTFNVTIYPSNVCETCVQASLETDSCYIVGSIVPVKLKTTAIEQIGGFDLLISYDASVLAFLSAKKGDAIPDWEYFTYAIESGTCGGACPSGLLRLVAIADRANGPYHPPTEQLSPDGTIAVINLRITHDQNVGGQFLPLNFFWLDCGDNAFSDPTGNSLYIDAIIYDAFGSVIWDEADEGLFPEANRLPYTGAPDSCLAGDKVTPIRCIEFHNGGICVTHPDDIDDRGDLNLNAVAYEIADAVVFTNYFIHGFAAFQVNVAGQTAASDVNADGTPLTVADLVYLIRVITGDASPNPKIAPDNAVVKLIAQQTGTSLNVDAELNYPVGAGLLVFEYDGLTPAVPVLSGLPEGMDMVYSIDNNEIRVLIYSFEKDTKINIGQGDLLNIGFSGEGHINLTEAIFAGYAGEELPTLISSKILPTEFRLSQNYPNPFNPTTTIEFTVPVSCHYCLSIYNMNGQVVKKYDGDAEPGTSKVVWDGTGFDGRTVATGIYLYKIDAGEFSDTRKMIMLK